MPVLQEIREGGVPVKVYTGEIDAAARQQLVNVSRLPIVHHHVAAMPDVHFGIGATVGSVIPTLRAIIPAAVGVDIGCGMIAARLSLSGNQVEELAYSSNGKLNQKYITVYDSNGREVEWHNIAVINLPRPDRKYKIITDSFDQLGNWTKRKPVATNVAIAMPRTIVLPASAASSVFS